MTEEVSGQRWSDAFLLRFVKIKKYEIKNNANRNDIDIQLTK